MFVEKLRRIFTKERTTIWTVFFFAAIGVALGCVGVFGATLAGENTEHPNRLVFKAFTDYYSKANGGAVKTTLGWAFIGGLGAIVISLWATVWMVGKIREIKRINDAGVSNGEVVLAIVGIVIIMTLAIGSIVAQSNLNDESWVAEQFAKGFEGWKQQV